MLTVIDGRTYRPIPAPRNEYGTTCEDCVAQHNSLLCVALPACPGLNFVEQYILPPAAPASKAWGAYEGTGRSLTAAQQAEQERVATEYASPPTGTTEARSYKPVHGGWPKYGSISDRAERYFDANARSTDPATSKVAASAVSGGKLCDQIIGALQAKASLCADMFKAEDGCTGKELATVTGIALNSVTPRFAQLRRAGLIHAKGSRDGQTVWKLGNGMTA